MHGMYFFILANGTQHMCPQAHLETEMLHLSYIASEPKHNVLCLVFLFQYCYIVVHQTHSNSAKAFSISAVHYIL